MTTLNAEKLNTRLPDYWDAYMDDDGVIRITQCDEPTFQIVDNKLEYPKTLEQILEEVGDNLDHLTYEQEYRKVEGIIQAFIWPTTGRWWFDSKPQFGDKKVR